MRAFEFINEARPVRQNSVRRQNRRGSRRLEFKGYRCTKDCSGHKAGYYWAKSKGINHPRQCIPGNSNSFWEGCKSCGQGR